MQHTKEVLVAIGLTIAIAVIVGAVLGGSSISQAQTEDLEIQEITLMKGSSGDAQLKVKIKNAGNSPLSGIAGQLNFDTVPGDSLNPFTFDFTPSALEPGASTVFVGNVDASANRMLIGEYFTLNVNGITQQNSTIQDTGIASVSRS